MREAVSCLRKAIELNPKHVGAQLSLAQLMASTAEPGLLEEANKRLAALLDANPEDPDALNALALTELKLGRVQDGMEHLSAVLAKDPRKFASSLLLAKAKWAQHDAQGVEDVLKQARDQDPKASTPLVALGSFYASQDKLAEAEQQFQRALQVSPQDGPAMANLGMLQRQLGRNQEAENSFRRLSTSPDAAYRPMLAVFFFELGRRDEAIREFERLSKADPADRQSRTRLITAYRAVNRVPDAEKILSAALKKNPTDLDALLQRSELYTEVKKYPLAENDLNQVLHYRPTSGEAHYILAKVRQAQGATLTYRQELSEAIRLNPYLLAARMEWAQLLIQANDAKSAVETLNDTPSAQKNLPVLLVQRNWALWSIGDMEQFRKGVDQGLAITRSPDFLIQDSMLKLRKGDSAGSRTVLEEALKLNPGDLRALEVLKQTYLAQKQSPMAVQKVKEYAAQAPKSAAVQEFLGTFLMATGDLKAARTALAASTGDDINFIPAYLSLAQLDAAEQKWSDAASRLNNVLAIDAGNTRARLWLGNIEALRGNRQQALEQYRKVVAADSTNAQALNNLAYLTMEYGNEPNEALKYAEKARELAPKDPAYADTLGWILYQKGLYPQALKSLELAAAHEDDVVWKYHLAMAYAKAGNIALGRATLAAALKRNPSVPEAKMAQEVVRDSSK